MTWNSNKTNKSIKIIAIHITHCGTLCILSIKKWFIGKKRHKTHLSHGHLPKIGTSCCLWCLSTDIFMTLLTFYNQWNFPHGRSRIFVASYNWNKQWDIMRICTDHTVLTNLWYLIISFSFLENSSCLQQK